MTSCRDLTLTKQAQNKLAAAQTKMGRSMLNIKCKDSRTNIWVTERTKSPDRHNQQCEKNEVVLGRTHSAGLAYMAEVAHATDPAL